MSKIIARIGAVLVALTAAAALVVSAGTASSASERTTAAIPAACYDFFKLWNYYMSIGDTATANALLSNLIGMGCFDDIPPPME